jgi:hypothetical protein
VVNCDLNEFSIIDPALIAGLNGDGRKPFVRDHWFDLDPHLRRSESVAMRSYEAPGTPMPWMVYANVHTTRLCLMPMLAATFAIRWLIVESTATRILPAHWTISAPPIRP